MDTAKKDAIISLVLNSSTFGKLSANKEMDLRIVKNFNTRLYANNDERLAKLAVEWQGTISWHREESMALLRTQD